MAEGTVDKALDALREMYRLSEVGSEIEVTAICSIGRIGTPRAIEMLLIINEQVDRYDVNNESEANEIERTKKAIAEALGYIRVPLS